MSLDVGAVIKSAFSLLVDSIAERKHQATAQHVSEYLQTNELERIAESIVEATSSCVGGLVEGLDNGFSNVNLEPLENQCKTAKQGVYCLLVLFDDDEGYRIYVGSASGENGLKRRIYEQHLNPIYRKRAYQYVYTIMDHPRARTVPICLASYDQRVPAAQVILSEAVFACIFGAYGTKPYMALRSRLKELRDVNWGLGTNRADPLATGDGQANRRDLAFNQRAATLAKAEVGGPFWIATYHHVKENRTMYSFFVFKLRFQIPAGVVEAWDLKHQSPTINVDFQLVHEKHPNAYAPYSLPTDDGSSLGIWAWKMINGVRKEYWAKKHTYSAIAEANSLHDWLENRIEDPETYQWGVDRIPFFGPVRLTGSNGLGSKERQEAWEVEVERRKQVYGHPPPLSLQALAPPPPPPPPLPPQPSDPSPPRSPPDSPATKRRKLMLEEEENAAGTAKFMATCYERWLRPHHREQFRRGIRNPLHW